MELSSAIQQSGIQNSLKHPRWSSVNSTRKEVSTLEVWLGSEYDSEQTFYHNLKTSYPLHKQKRFPLRISSDFAIFTEEILIGKLLFLCIVCEVKCNKRKRKNEHVSK